MGFRSFVSGVLVVAATGFAVPFPLAAGAQEAEPESPGLETLLVTAPRVEPLGPVSETHHSLDAAELKSLRPQTAADLLRRLPASHVLANSRGETLVYLRSAGERQVAAFFDGALLNVPWDNRYDLNLLPAAVIGRVATATGTLSPQYGVNALGAVAFFPARPAAAGTEFEVDLRIGTQGEQAGQSGWSTQAGPVHVLVAAGAFDRDGVALPASIDLPFHQPSEELRLNTDRSGRNALARAELELGGSTISGTFLYTDLSRGIAPESDRPDARFWRTPQARTAMGILSGQSGIGSHGRITGTLWLQDFRQTIDSFPDAGYRIPEARQKDNDRTYGARGIFQYGLGNSLITASVNFLESRHDQTDTALSAGVPVSSRQQTYRQHAASFGMDTEHDLTDRLTLEFGAGLDQIDYVETGDKPPLDAILQPVLRLGVAWALRENIRLRGALGRKSRMPTMRELFGTALNRFLLNPDLQPETIRTAEMSLEARRGQADLSVTLFGQDVVDTIDQRRVDGMRQRINLEGSTVVGLELAGMARLGERWRLSGQLTATRARRKTGAHDTTDRLAERPGVLARLAVDYELGGGLRTGAEMFYTGSAFSIAPEGDLVELDDAVELHLQASYALPADEGHEAELYLTVRNLFDAPLFAQAGLPGPGRSLAGGVRFRL